MNQLVVALYREDISWLKDVPKHWDILIYCKDHRPVDGKVVYLENVGREGHSFLTHICSHYETLPEITAFVQGNPLDHSPQLLQILEGRSMIELADKTLKQFPTNKPVVRPYTGLIGIGHLFNGLNQKVIDPVHEVMVQKTIEEIWEHEGKTRPNKFRSIFGFQTVMTRDLIHSKPKNWYQWLLSYTEIYNAAPWALERIWFDLLYKDPPIL
jgi:hypothetical protein